METQIEQLENNMKSMPLTEAEKAEILRRVRYDPHSGRFFWNVDVKEKGFRAGDEVRGCMSAAGYLRIGLRRKLYTMHRTAWLLMTGEWPEQIDHINHNRADNKFSNLRAATNSENGKNRSTDPRNKSGVNGVDWYARDKKWRVQICVGGQRHWLGCYSSLDEAIAVREAANSRFGFHQNHGKDVAA